MCVSRLASAGAEKEEEEEEWSPLLEEEEEELIHRAPRLVRLLEGCRRCRGTRECRPSEGGTRCRIERVRPLDAAI